ncbi:putative ABC transport system permease protein [Breznakia sp. PF5-3]|uniref:ABC transporter permease n=1 Tax=unclassified Breznakia TaxID=2623764 RepID=UPI002406E3C3|nr:MULTISPECIES: ABC transporter permease [unclassified Breznakia]MDF9823951.1 putative ABC transport system permease protein [Breznakia sp. PM6-1]MDF9834750.1 putative ABC transport system permease protein [Breznakia sp. PF5-3]MDF9836814.1 putative ABC transport system permease protein [Breznakia sp. PFB2-8]MDF9858832.1 putative ABC transport system permease protein [Breznakia sp. PH5-24]
MNFIKRALLSTIRKKGKSIILLVVIFILGNLMAGSIAVKQATVNVEKTVKNKLGAEAVVDYDWENLSEDKIPKLDQKTIDKIGKLDGVKYYEYNVSSFLNSKEYESYCGPDCEMGVVDGIGAGFEIYGVQIPSILDISEKKISLSEGRVFKQQEIDEGKPVALVSTIFAEMNNIHVGDTVTFTAAVYDWEDMDGNGDPKVLSTKDYSMDVIGIFDASLSIKEETGEDGGMVDYYLTQRIYVPNDLASKANNWMMEEEKKVNQSEEEYENFESLNATYYLKDASQLEEFRDDAKKLLPKGFAITISSDAYDSVAGPISFISWLATGILYISIGATILILGLVVILFLRDRRHEFGIYLSIGVRKWKIVAQIVIEVLIVGIIALTLSLFSGKELANGVSQKMIEQQVINEDPYGYTYTSYMDSNVDQNEVLDAYEVTLDGDYIVMLYLIGLGTLLVSSIAPTLYVVRLKPRKVLM